MILGGFMKKYVHNIKKFLTQTDFEVLCYELNYPNTSKMDILKVLGIENIEELDLEDIEATIQVSSVKKDIDSFKQTLEFIFSELEDYERNYVIQYLKSNKIDFEHGNIEEFRTILQYIISNKNLMTELNNVDLTTSDIEKLLQKYHIEVEPITIQNIMNLIRYITGIPTICLPTIRNKYYDEHNNVVTKIKILNDGINNLESFEGKIFEYLSFQNEEEIKKFKETYQIDQDIDIDTTSVIHFKGREKGSLDNNEIYIIKQKLCIYIYYDVPHFLIVKERNQGLKSEEICSIRELLIRNTPDNEFRKYVLRELKSLEKSIQKKEYIRNHQMIDEMSREEIHHILKSKDYEENEYIYFQAEIVSSKKIQLENQKNSQYVLKKQ